MRTRSRAPAWSSVAIAGVLVGVGIAVVIITLGLSHHRQAPAAPRTAAGSPTRPPRSTGLDQAGMADLMVLRRVTSRTAVAATAAVESCLRRHGAAPMARRARAVRNCAFRPLAAAGASQGANAVIVAGLQARLRSGRCLAMVNAYAALIVGFSSSAEAVVRTTGEWPQTEAAAASADRLGRWMVRASHHAPWSAACVIRASGLQLHETA